MSLLAKIRPGLEKLSGRVKRLGQYLFARAKTMSMFLGALAVLALVLTSFFTLPVVRDYPDYEVSLPESNFDQERAYALLETLVTEYPRRVVGSEAAQESALWVEEYLVELGLQVSSDRFTSDYFLPRAGQKSSRGLYLKDMYGTATVVNVVAVSAGQVEELVVIGAHRDVDGAPGILNNGSGTAVMMELARALSAQDHYYTYMFVSFDGSEAGMLGSRRLASQLAREPVAMVITLDKVGMLSATTMGLGNIVTRSGQPPLGTVALARALPQSNQDQHYAGSRRGYLWQRLVGLSATDSRSFMSRGIPALGLTSTQLWLPLGSEDTLDRISPSALGRAGRFVEGYVYALPQAADAGSVNYIPLNQGYIPGWFYSVHLVLALLCLLALPVANLLQGGNYEHLRQEWRWLLPGAIIALLSVLYVWSLKMKLVADGVLMPLYVVGMLLLGAAAVITLICAAAVRSQQSSAASQRTALNVALGVLVVIGIPIAGPLFTVLAMTVPVAVLSRPGYCRYTTLVQGLVWGIASFAALALFISRVWFTTAGYITAANLLLQFWVLMLVYVTGLYIFARPTDIATAEAEDSWQIASTG